MIYLYCFGTAKKCDTIDDLKKQRTFYIGIKLGGKRKLNKKGRELLGGEMIYQILTKIEPNILPETTERKKYK